MPKTPQKKRSGHLIASPETTLSAATNKSVGERNKTKKKYKFAPIDNLENATKAESNILKSISVSQVRNSGNHLAPASSIANRDKLPEPLRKTPNSDELVVSRPKVAANTSYHKTIEGSHEAVTEKVIWEYSPANKDVSDQMCSSHENSDDFMAAGSCQNPSSTPMVPKRLKSVLNFGNGSDREHQDRDSPSGQQKLSVRSRDTGSFKESLRDIDDILGDMEEDITSEPKLRNLNEFPSSPSALHSDSQSENDSKFLKTSSSDFANDDEESLIEVLTQRATKTKSEPVIVHTDPLDDSLIDQLEELGEKERVSKFEREIGDMEVRISQTLKMESKATDNDESELIEIAKSPISRNGLKRFAVLSVNELSLPKVGRQKILSCIDGDGKNSSVIVRHPWVYLEFVRGDVIHVIEGKNTANKRLLSDDKDQRTQFVNDNLLILNPDILISATSVGNSVECLRRAILQMTLDDPRGEPSLPMVIGNIVHELLQSSLKYKLSHGQLNLAYLEKMLDSLLDVYSFEILQCNENVAEVRTEICKTHLHNIIKFTNKFVQKSNYGCYVSVSGTRMTKPLSISNVFDIEENIWSHIYGLKGFLDATVEAHIENDYFLVPLEVKTGKRKNISHETQGLVYSLLLNDRYEVPTSFFLLMYTRDCAMTMYPKVLHSIKHVLMLRNQMATQLKYQLKEITSKERFHKRLPPLLQNSTCDTCSAKATCMVLNRLVEDGTSEESGLKAGEYDILTEHLLSNSLENKKFFEKYNDLISKEESSVNCISQELFLIDSATRESLSGRCICNLTVSNSTRHPVQKHLFLHHFVRKSNAAGSRSMLDSQLTLNDMVIISDEQGHFSLCQGRINDITRDSITVSSRRKVLNNNVLRDSSHSTPHRSLIDADSGDASALENENAVSFRIDKNEVQNTLKLARFNLLNLFLPPSTHVQPYEEEEEEEEAVDPSHLKPSDGGDERMRAILVDNKPPKFRESNQPPVVAYKSLNDKHFNPDQLKAIDKVMRAEDYSLILGMPGTGKTTVIAEIIKILTAAGKSVLLASYTHSAVDNILLKLVSTQINILRLGVRHRINTKLLAYQPNYDSIKSYNDLVSLINKVSVVATTCLGINDYMFTMRQDDFDYVILDEASQISLPIALGPIRYGKKFIMVGDHHQLPPLIKNDAARSSGLEESLFKILCDKQEMCVAELTYQYRMCGEIASLSNFLVYNGNLKCGNEFVANQCLQIPNFKNLNEHLTENATEKWLHYVLNPAKKVVFLNYDKNKSIIETCKKDNITNEGEIEIIMQCLQAMIECGVDSSEIGVLTLYRAQLNLLRKTLNSSTYAAIETFTADQFQGRDKHCIIISMVRKNPKNNAGSLLKELRRVNVAMTRAKSKLIIIGSKATITSAPKILDLMEFLDERGWIYELSDNFLDSYHFTNHVQSSENDKVLDKHGSLIQDALPSPKIGSKNVGSASRIVRDKPIIRQIVSEFQ